MKRMTFDGSEQKQQPAYEQKAPLACAAEGCKWIATSGDGGRFACIAHAKGDPDSWRAITDKTRELQWFADFIGDVQKLINQTGRGASWVELANKFWESQDDRMLPKITEIASPGLYLYRMLGELRAMALGEKRPPPHVPQGRTPEWAARRKLSSEVCE